MIKALWQGTVFVRASFLLHLFAMLGMLFYPAQWLSILITLFLNHTIILIIGMWPRSKLLGDNWTQLPLGATQRKEIALTIDDGPDPEVTPQVLDLLEQQGVVATFFVIGEKANRYPELCLDMVRRGHTLENHTQNHRHSFAFMGVKAFYKEIHAAQTTLTSLTGSTPAFFRAPAGVRNPLLAPVLKRLNLILVSWTTRGFDTRVSNAERVKRRLLSSLSPGAIVLLHDGNAARTNAGIPIILEVLPVLIQAATLANLRFVTLRNAFKTV
jgi:peptidoglycan/xylan/chitin deacetylase (PgdA/CDA1 family)